LDGEDRFEALDGMTITLSGEVDISSERAKQDNQDQWYPQTNDSYVSSFTFSVLPKDGDFNGVSRRIEFNSTDAMTASSVLEKKASASAELVIEGLEGQDKKQE
jgi:hypothetical protein